MPVRHCIAVNCTSNSRRNKYLRFHQLPKVDVVRNKWLELVKREGFDVKPGADNRHHVVCEKHFVDGHPTVKNPFPTLFHNNTSKFKKRAPKKCINFVVRRDVRNGSRSIGFQIKPAAKKVKLKLRKCSEDQRSQNCYQYVTGEIDVLTSSTRAGRSRRHTCHDGKSAVEGSRFELQDHNYICADSREKYCQREKLLEHIVCLEAKYGKLEEENQRLRTENEILKLRSKIFSEVFLSEELQSGENGNQSLVNSSLTVLASKLQSISAFHDTISISKEARWLYAKQEKEEQ